MKIDPTGPAGPKAISKSKKAGKTRSGDFSKALSEGTSEASPVSGTTPINPADSVLALQQVESVDPEERKARERAETILDQLDQVRLAQLTGSMSRQSLQQLSHLVRVQREQFDNPRLAEVLDEIELRAEVELAKYAAARWFFQMSVRRYVRGYIRG